MAGQWRSLSVAAALLLTAAATDAATAPKKPASWNAAQAAQYLDQSEQIWSTWPRAELEDKTFCISCHTASLYALARPALRVKLGEKQPAAEESKLLDSVSRRVARWNEIEPYYPDQRYGLPKTSESRGSEAVINALVLATRDSMTGKLGDDTRRAFQHMWRLQLQKGDVAGSWAWMNFKLDPWEGERSAFYGAALAAMAVGRAPEGYAKSPELHDGLDALRGYVQKRVGEESLFNAATALWATSALPDLLTLDQKKAVRDKLLTAQSGDGGWSISALGDWRRLDDSAAEGGNDAYATGLAVLALKSVRDSSTASNIQRAQAWLISHQENDGKWHAASVNKHREMDAVPGRFMNDAATALAVLALMPATGD